MSPSCDHQPSSILLAAAAAVPVLVPAGAGATAGRESRARALPAGRRLLQGPPQVPAERELGFQLAGLSHPQPRGATFSQSDVSPNLCSQLP